MCRASDTRPLHFEMRHIRFLYFPRRYRLNFFKPLLAQVKKLHPFFSIRHSRAVFLHAGTSYAANGLSPFRTFSLFEKERPRYVTSFWTCDIIPATFPSSTVCGITTVALTKNDRRQSVQSEISLYARHELIEKLAQSTLRRAERFCELTKSKLLLLSSNLSPIFRIRLGISGFNVTIYAKRFRNRVPFVRSERNAGRTPI